MRQMSRFFCDCDCDFLREAPVRFGSVTVSGWNGSSGSGFRFRRFLCKKGFSVFQYILTGKDGSGSGFGSWKTVPAVPVPLSVSGKTVPTVPVSGSGSVPEPPCFLTQVKKSQRCFGVQKVSLSPHPREPCGCSCERKSLSIAILFAIFRGRKRPHSQGPLNGGVSNGGVSESGLVLPLLSFFVLFGIFLIFPGFSRFARGWSGDFPDSSLFSFSAY